MQHSFDLDKLERFSKAGFRSSMDMGGPGIALYYVAKILQDYAHVQTGEGVQLAAASVGVVGLMVGLSTGLLKQYKIEADKKAEKANVSPSI